MTCLTPPRAAQDGVRRTGRRRAARCASRCSCTTTERLSLRLGVSWPPSSVHSSGSTTNLRIDSALETALLASSTAWSISARRSASSSSASRSPDLPCRSAQPGSASRSRVTRAPMKGWPSPTTTHWSTSGWARSRSSSTAGATFLPPAVTRISFLRPVIRTKPSSSTSPTSPVWNQPSRSSASALAGLVGPVAGEDLAAAEEQLAVVGDPDGRARHRAAHGADPGGVGGVDAQRGRGLGEAVALEHGQADAAVEVAQALAQRRTTRDGELAAPAQGVAQLGVDQPREDRVRGAHPQRRTPLVLGARPGDRGLGGPVEDRAATLGGGLLRGGVEDLLEDPRHGEDEGGLELLEVGQQVLDVGAVPQAGALLDRTDLDDPGEDVGQRQEEQRGGALGVEEGVELVGGHAELEHEVAVGEHAALGPPGGARGVDQGGQVAAASSPYAAPPAARRRCPRPRRVSTSTALSAKDHRWWSSCSSPRTAATRATCSSLSATTAQAPESRRIQATCSSRRGLVDRHGDRAGEPDRVVEQGPLVAGLGDQRDPVAGLDAGRDEALGDPGDVGEELRGRDVLPPGAVRSRAAEHDRVRRLGGVGDDVVGEVPGRGDLDRQGRGELTHVCLLHAHCSSHGLARCGRGGTSCGTLPPRTRDGPSGTVAAHSGERPGSPPAGTGGQ